MRYLHALLCVMSLILVGILAAQANWLIATLMASSAVCQALVSKIEFDRAARRSFLKELQKEKVK